MPGGVVFLVCVSTFSYEHELIFGLPLKRTKKIEKPEKLLVGPKVDVRLRQTKSRMIWPIGDIFEVEDGRRDSDPIFVSMETIYYAF